jgi:hypothetical protein
MYANVVLSSPAGCVSKWTVGIVVRWVSFERLARVRL